MTTPHHHTALAQARRTRLGLALAMALLPALASADEAREAALEARVAELERLVQQLVAERQAPAAPAAGTAAPAAPAIQSTPILPAANPNSRFSYGGFIKLDAMLTDTSDGEIADGSAGRLLYVPSAIPVGGADEGTDLDMHAQFSRLWFSADTTLDSGDVLKGYIELDLFGGALGNEVATNTYGVAVRHAYASWNKWLAGQTWSNFQDVAALPDAVDFIGPTDGTVFVRQAQVRYTSGPWAFSLENPETLVNANNSAAKAGSDDNRLPDMVLRHTTRGDWGHFSVAGIVRELRHEVPASGIDDSSTGYGISLSGKQVINASNDFRYMLTAGSGLGRYIGLGTHSDVVLDGDGELDEIGVLAGYAAWRHVISPTLRSNLYYAAAHYDNELAFTGPAVTRKVHSLSGNLIWTVLPKLDVGVELRLAERELESGVDGDLRRLQLHAKYSF